MKTPERSLVRHIAGVSSLFEDIGGLGTHHGAVEHTIADLVETNQDLSTVADAYRDASLRMTVNRDRLEELLVPLAQRNGFPKSDGAALLRRLQELAGLDIDRFGQLCPRAPRGEGRTMSSNPRCAAAAAAAAAARDLGGWVCFEYVTHRPTFGGDQPPTPRATSSALFGSLGNGWQDEPHA